MSDQFDYYQDDPDAPCEHCGVQDDHKDTCPTRPWNRSEQSDQYYDLPKGRPWENPKRTYTYYTPYVEEWWPSAVVMAKMRLLTDGSPIGNQLTRTGYIGDPIRDGVHFLAGGYKQITIESHRKNGRVTHRVWSEEFFTCGYACKGWTPSILLWETEHEEVSGPTEWIREKRFYELSYAVGDAIKAGFSADQLDVLIRNYKAEHESNDDRFSEPWRRWA